MQLNDRFILFFLSCLELIWSIHLAEAMYNKSGSFNPLLALSEAGI